MGLRRGKESGNPDLLSFTMAKSPESLTATLDRILHRGDDGSYLVALIKPQGADPLVAIGRLPQDAQAGDDLELFGTYEDHARYGKQFRVRSGWLKTPDSMEGIRRYLASGRIEGVGKKLAERLLAHFGAETLRVLEETPERLREVPGVGKKRQKELIEVFASGREKRDTMVFLLGLQLGPAAAEAVWDRYGAESRARVRENPYGLAEAVDGIGFLTADRIAQGLGIAPDSPLRLSAGLHFALRDAMEQGHMGLPPRALVERAAALLRIEGEPLEGPIKEECERGTLVAHRSTGGIGNSHDPLVQLPVLFRVEEEAVRRLVDLASAEKSPVPPFQPSRCEAGELTLSAEQIRCLEVLTVAPIGVLTGGPGVGKTTVLRALVAHYKASNLRVSLASPTGRAARRMQEATGEEAQTLHRMFGLAPNLAHRGESRWDGADLLVIDESSMLDLPVFVQVLRRIPDSTRVLLVGDPEQLPSVGPGSVLKDLLQSDRFVVGRLTEIFRQAAESDIVQGAHQILRCQIPRFRKRGEDGDAYFVDAGTPEAATSLITRLVCERIPERFHMDPRKDVQVLAPMHRGLAGVEHLNAMLQVALSQGAMPLEFGNKRFFSGDRVIQKRNDYDRDVMNGELGFVLDVFPGNHSLRVGFEGKDPMTYQGKHLDDLDPAFALTVHKSQGAEFPAVILALFPEHQLMLRRSVLYTAVTRARRLLVVVGTRAALSTAVADTRTQERHGLFLDLLSGRTITREIPNFPGVVHEEP